MYCIPAAHFRCFGKNVLSNSGDDIFDMLKFLNHAVTIKHLAHGSQIVAFIIYAGILGEDTKLEHFKNIQCYVMNQESQ